VIRHLGRLLAVLALALLCLQFWFAGRILLMRFVAPQSTSFQRSEIVRLLAEKHQVAWSQQWVDDAQLPATLKRAVIASEDDGFALHGGVDWDALKGAWKKNEKAQARVEARGKGVAKVVGGSTINYCAATTHSAGGPARIFSAGPTSVSGNDFLLRALDVVPGAPCLFFYGPTALQAPFGNGVRCVGGQVSRLGVTRAAPDGRVETTLDFTARPAASGAGRIDPGSTWRFQLIYRDFAAGGAGFNLTEGLAVTFCP